MTEPIAREALHLRNIDMRGYRRGDGLFEVEGRVVDRKTHSFAQPAPGRTLAAGETLHNMGVRLVFDEDLLVHDVETFTDAAPYPPCFKGGRALRSIVGMRMVAGWAQGIRSRLGGGRSCTHLMELLIPMATTAHQTLGYLRIQQPDRLDAHGRPVQIGSCYAYAPESEVVLQRWPQFHKLAG